MPFLSTDEEILDGVEKKCPVSAHLSLTFLYSFSPLPSTSSYETFLSRLPFNSLPAPQPPPPPSFPSDRLSISPLSSLRSFPRFAHSPAHFAFVRDSRQFLPHSAISHAQSVAALFTRPVIINRMSNLEDDPAGWAHIIIPRAIGCDLMSVYAISWEVEEGTRWGEGIRDSKYYPVGMLSFPFYTASSVLWHRYNGRYSDSQAIKMRKR